MKSVARISLAVSLLALSLSILALAPPHRQRQWRHQMASLMVWLWVKSAHVSRVLHDEFWSEGNGKVHNVEMGSNDFLREG